jgi:hypothetical protein
MNRNNFDEWLSGQTGWATTRLRAWMDHRPAFQRFVLAHAAAIRKKLLQAVDPEDRSDVLAELEFAYRGLQQPGWEFDYQPPGTGRVRTADYRVRIGGIEAFNLEVKRVREGKETLALQTFVQDILVALKAIPTGCGVSIHTPAQSDTDGFVDRLEEAKKRVIRSCVETAREQTQGLSAGDTVEVLISDFDSDDLRITLERLGHRPADFPTVNLGGVMAIPYTQRESFKFTDIICGAVGQLRDGMPNVLAVRVQSCTHENVEFDHAVAALGRLASSQGDDYFRRKGFDDAADYHRQLLRLSVAVVVNDWTSADPGQQQNHVWRNPEAAVPLAVEIIEALRVL